MSSTVLSLGMLTVLEMAPLMNGCAARHHLQVGQVMDAALAAIRLEGAVEDRQMLRLQAARDGLAAVGDVFNGVELLDVRDDALGFLRRCSRAGAALRARCG